VKCFSNFIFATSLMPNTNTNQQRGLGLSPKHGVHLHCLHAGFGMGCRGPRQRHICCCHGLCGQHVASVGGLPLVGANVQAHFVPL